MHYELKIRLTPHVRQLPERVADGFNGDCKRVANTLEHNLRSRLVSCGLVPSLRGLTVLTSTTMYANSEEELVADLAAPLCRVDLVELDEAVDEAASLAGSTANNGGCEAQARFLLETLGEKEAREVIERLTAERVNVHVDYSALELRVAAATARLATLTEEKEYDTDNDQAERGTSSQAGEKIEQSTRITGRAGKEPRPSVEHCTVTKGLRGPRFPGTVRSLQAANRQGARHDAVSGRPSILFQLQAARGIINCGWFWPPEDELIEQVEPFKTRIQLMMQASQRMLVHWTLSFRYIGCREYVFPASTQIGKPEDCLCIME